MILRRFNEHVKDQNWFAVWLDLIVVVVGIFLGLQVTQWNDDRQDVKWEQEFYRDLKGDLVRDVEHLGAVIEFQSGKGDRLRAALERLTIENVLPGDDSWDARVEVTSWESREYYDPIKHDFLRWNEKVADAVRAEFAFLIRENDIYMGLVQTLDEELRTLISALDQRTNGA